MKILNTSKKNWPNFFIVGAAKSGTTALYEYLNKIEDIYMSPIKEPNHFSPNHQIFRRDKLVTNEYFDIKKYLKLFSDVKNEKRIGEASPSYLSDPESPRLIKKKCPNAKIIIILRDPVERCFSHYLDRTKTGNNSLSISDLVAKKLEDMSGRERNNKHRIIERSYYYEPIKRYQKYFSENNIKIIGFEEFILNPLKKLNELLEFLELKQKTKFKFNTYNEFKSPKGIISKKIIDSNVIRDIGSRIFPDRVNNYIMFNILNSKGRKPKLREEDSELLKRIYEDDVKKLQILLKHDFNWKNFDDIKY